MESVRSHPSGRESAESGPLTFGPKRPPADLYGFALAMPRLSVSDTKVKLKAKPGEEEPVWRDSLHLKDRQPNDDVMRALKLASAQTGQPTKHVPSRLAESCRRGQSMDCRRLHGVQQSVGSGPVSTLRKSSSVEVEAALLRTKSATGVDIYAQLLGVCQELAEA